MNLNDVERVLFQRLVAAEMTMLNNTDERSVYFAAGAASALHRAVAELGMLPKFEAYKNTLRERGVCIDLRK